MKKAKRTNHSKTRVLYPDLGKANDVKYYTLSSTTFGNCMRPKPERENYILPIYMANKALRNYVSSPDFSSWPMGVESLNSKVTNERMRWCNCVHLSQRSMQHPYGRIALAWNQLEGRYSTEYIEPYWRRSGVGLTYWRDAANTALANSLSDEQLFSARAFWSMRPKFQSDVSLINSIFEIKDFSDIAKYLFSAKGLTRAVVNAAHPLKSFAKAALSTNVRAWPNYVSDKMTFIAKSGNQVYSWLSKPGPAMGDVFEKTTELGASAILTYNLAVKPTIQDAISIHAAAQKDVFELARTFQKYGEEGARSHYSEENVLFSNLVYGSYNNNLWGRGKHVWQKRSAMMVSYYTTLWQRLEDRYPKWWGLEIGADEIWNMLPLSFVLDYVFTVGKSLEYMDIDKSLDVHHVDYLESVKTLATSGVHYLHNARTSHLVINDVYLQPRSKDKALLVTGTMGKYYKREVKEPYKGPALPQFKAPSGTQAVNLLALVRCLLF